MRTFMILLIVPICITFALDLDSMVCTSIAVKSSDTTYSSMTVFDYDESGLERACFYSIPVDTVDTFFCTSDADSMEQLLLEITGIEKADSIERYVSGDTLFRFQMYSDVVRQKPLIVDGDFNTGAPWTDNSRPLEKDVGWAPGDVLFWYEPDNDTSTSIDESPGEFYQKLQNVYDNDEISFIITYKDQWTMAGGVFIFFDPDDKSDRIFLQYRTEDNSPSYTLKRAIVSHTYKDGNNAWVGFSISGALYEKHAYMYQVIAVKTGGGRKPDVGISLDRRAPLPFVNKTGFGLRAENYRQYTVSGRLVPRSFVLSHRVIVTNGNKIVVEMRK